MPSKPEIHIEFENSKTIHRTLFKKYIRSIQDNHIIQRFDQMYDEENPPIMDHRQSALSKSTIAERVQVSDNEIEIEEAPKRAQRHHHPHSQQQQHHEQSTHHSTIQSTPSRKWWFMPNTPSETKSSENSLPLFLLGIDPVVGTVRIHVKQPISYQSMAIRLVGILSPDNPSGVLPKTGTLIGLKGGTRTFLQIERQLSTKEKILHGPHEWKFNFGKPFDEYESFEGRSSRVMYYLEFEIVKAASSSQSIMNWSSNLKKKQELWVKSPIYSRRIEQHSSSLQKRHQLEQQLQELIQPKPVKNRCFLDDETHTRRVIEVRMRIDSTCLPGYAFVEGMLDFVQIDLLLRYGLVKIIRVESLSEKVKHEDVILNFDIMDGNPQPGSKIRFRVPLTAIPPDILIKSKTYPTFDVQYVLHVEFSDEHERRVFKRLELSIV